MQREVERDAANGALRWLVRRVYGSDGPFERVLAAAAYTCYCRYVWCELSSGLTVSTAGQRAADVWRCCRLLPPAAHVSTEGCATICQVPLLNSLSRAAHNSVQPRLRTLRTQNAHSRLNRAEVAMSIVFLASLMWTVQRASRGCSGCSLSAGRYCAPAPCAHFSAPQLAALLGRCTHWRRGGRFITAASPIDVVSRSKATKERH